MTLPPPPTLAAPLRRVVVTGLGAASPLGRTLPETWSALTGIRRRGAEEGGAHDDDDDDDDDAGGGGGGGGGDHDVGISSLEYALLAQDLTPDTLDRELSLARSLPCRVAAPVRGADRDPRTARFVQFALMAGGEAAGSAGLDAYLGIGDGGGGYADSDSDESDAIRRRRDRAGCCFGSGMSSTRAVVEASHASYPRGTVRRVTPHFIPFVSPNSAAGRLSLSLKLRGPNHSASTACAAGAHSVGDAMRFIQCGDADVMVAGGAEASIDPLSVGGFCRLRALSTSFNDDPPLSSRPFDAERDGFVMGEGAAALVLEDLDHARARGAAILCEVRGYGLSGDAHHITSPDPRGVGATRAMAAALERAGISPGAVDHVNAHATSTPVGDDIEAAAIDSALVRGEGAGTDRERDLYVSSTKGMTGHLLGAAGALEAAFTVMSIVEGRVPHTANLAPGGGSAGGVDVGFKHVTERALETEVHVAMSNSFGFGGTNASLVFARYSEDN